MITWLWQHWWPRFTWQASSVVNIHCKITTTFFWRLTRTVLIASIFCNLVIFKITKTALSTETLISKLHSCKWVPFFITSGNALIFRIFFLRFCNASSKQTRFEWIFMAPCNMISINLQALSQQSCYINLILVIWEMDNHYYLPKYWPANSSL